MTVDIKPILDHLSEPHRASLMALSHKGGFPHLKDLKEALNAPHMAPVREALEPVGVWYVCGDLSDEDSVFTDEGDAMDEAIDLIHDYIRDEYRSIKAWQAEALEEQLMGGISIEELDIDYD